MINKYLKKIKIIIILLLTVLVFFTAACSNEAKDKEDIKIHKASESGISVESEITVSDAAVTKDAVDNIINNSQESSDISKNDLKEQQENKDNVQAKNKKEEHYCTFSITCKTILDNIEDLDETKLDLVPEDGIISENKKVQFSEGDSVFDVLLKQTKDNGIHMEFVSTPIFNSNYIEGINNIYEFDCGELSGWMYKVNDWFPNYGCSNYILKDGDEIEWIYTCDLGRDIGGDWTKQNTKE
ncbi:DUF4430 domain-containing protein [Anaerovorax odorimutans]|uniref:DUF4430 domain-containing protein n=1 Tax=Anaerovorax odorimutans TaxID=109327 RepID=UPI0003F7BDB9|nr:DUF4430 domain-containing protein [Anaerovorax odorimutans]